MLNGQPLLKKSANTPVSQAVLEQEAQSQPQKKIKSDDKEDNDNQSKMMSESQKAAMDMGLSQQIIISQNNNNNPQNKELFANPFMNNLLNSNNNQN